MFPIGLEELRCDLIGLFVDTLEGLKSTHKTIGCLTETNGKDGCVSSHNKTHLLVGPGAIVEVWMEKCHECIAAPKFGFDYVLPFRGRLDVRMRHERLDG